MTDLTIIAYNVSGGLPMPIVPADGKREWMDNTRDRFAYRCLPMLIANQAGWFILNSHRFRMIWNGGQGLNDLHIEYLEGGEPYPAISHFGHGILTFSLPYLFRTPTGYNLLARGPANLPKDGIAALEGLVETDLTSATFTMNWKVTRPNYEILFEVGEPVCMIVPQRKGEVEAFRGEIRAIEDAPDTQAEYNAWKDSRATFLDDLRVPGSNAQQIKWQKDYFQAHQTKLNVQPFTDTLAQNEPE